MPELEADAAARLMDVFMLAYNSRHGTHYNRFSEGAPGADADFICEGAAGEPPLKVQHTRAWADPRTEWAFPSDVRNFVMRNITKRLRDGDVRDRYVSLTVERLPPGARAKARFAEELWTAIQFGLDKLPARDPLRRVVHFDRRDWDQLYRPIEEFVPDLEILGIEPPDGRQAQVGWSADNGSTNGVLGATPRVVRAVEAKEERYGGTGTDLVLVVDFEVMPYFADEVAGIQDALAGEHAFREIWVSSPWVPPTAHCVWPVDKRETAATVSC